MKNRAAIFKYVAFALLGFAVLTLPVWVGAFTGPSVPSGTGYGTIDTDAAGNLGLDIAVSATTLAGSLTGTVNAANVSAGTFASSTGAGNFSFPGSLAIDTTSAAYKLVVSGDAQVSGGDEDWNGDGGVRPELRGHDPVQFYEQG